MPHLRSGQRVFCKGVIPMHYTIEVAGLKRDLPLCPLNEQWMIAAFVILGDPELTMACARDLLKVAPSYDYLLGPESKSFPLLHEMARQNGDKRYMVARKEKKLYMGDTIQIEDRSITTQHVQTLYLEKKDALLMQSKRVLLLDDVISTGGSMSALEHLAEKAGAHIVGKMAILAEGEAASRKDILYLQALPLFDSKGNPLS